MRKHNLRQIERYIVFHDILSRSSAGSLVDATSSDKPESSPPISEKGLDYLELNRDAACLIEPELKWLRRMWLAGRLIDEWRALNAVAGLSGEPDHGALKRWRAGETEEDRKWARTFDKGVEKIEERIHAKYPEQRLEVSLPEPASSKREDSMRRVRARTEDTYRKIEGEVQEIVEAKECTVEAAIQEYREWLRQEEKADVSPRKIKLARAFCKEAS